MTRAPPVFSLCAYSLLPPEAINRLLRNPVMACVKIVGGCFGCFRLHR